MTAVAADSFDGAAIGRQSNSQKETMPAYSFGTGSREVSRMKVYISARHEKAKCSMNSPGPVYSPSCHVGVGPKFSFGADEQRKHTKGQYPDSSVDLTCAEVDSQRTRFPATSGVHFGTESRMDSKNAEVIRVNPTMMFGVDSPGALQYSPKEDKVVKMAPQYSFGPQASPQTNGKVTPRITLPATGAPRAVGPGSNTVPGAIGSQPSSARRSAPAWSMGMGQSRHSNGQQESRQIVDTAPNVSSLGRQVFSGARTAPEGGFGKATRDHVARTALISTDADRGPVAFMAKPNYHIDLPPPCKRIAKPGM